MTKLNRLIFFFAFLIIADQVLKIYIKTTMLIGERVLVFPHWFYIHFTENPGMAFGMEFGGEWGKLALSLFRIFAVIVMSWYLLFLRKKGASAGLLVSFTLIIAGALGNIIDSAFYGLLFSNSYHSVAEFLPQSGGYAGFLHGHVVDMFYFPLIEGFYPEWFPGIGGQRFIFFSPIFNLADSYITVGVIIVLIFQKPFFGFMQELEKKDSVGTQDTQIQSNNSAI